MAYIAAVSRLLAAASGAFLAAATIASAGMAYADEPNDQSGQVSTQSAPGANLAGAVQPTDHGAAGPADAGTLGPIGDNAAHSPAANPAGNAAGNPAHDGTVRPEDEAAHPADDGMAAAPAAGGMNNMGASIGSSMAMMAPMMAMYVPMLGAPLLMSGLGSLGAAPSTGVDAATAASAAASDLAGSAAATDVLGAASPVAADLSNLDFTPALDPNLLSDALGGVGADAANGVAEAAGSSVADAAGQAAIDATTNIAGELPGIAADTSGDLASTGVGVGTEVACGVVGLIFGAC